MNFLVLGGLAYVSAKKQNVTQPHKSLQDVFGAIESIKSTIPFHHRRQSLASEHPTEWYEVREPMNCTFPIEVVFAQDCTGSFFDSFQNMLNDQLPEALSQLRHWHPDSRFGVVTFRDKPVWSLGDPSTNDWCVRFEQSLTFDENLIYEAYTAMVSDGGGDAFENQLGAIHSTCQSNKPGWQGDLATRLIVLSTDSPPHYEGDGYNDYGMTPFSGHFDEANQEEQCAKQYYPNLDQVKDAVATREAYVAFLVYDGEEWDNLPTRSWEYVNSYIGQDERFVGRLGEQASQFWASLAGIIHHIEELECSLSTTENPSVSATSDFGPESSTSQNITTDILTTRPPTLITSSVQSTRSDLSSAQSSSGLDCSCDTGCPCPEVEILLHHRPKALRFSVINFDEQSSSF